MRFSVKTHWLPASLCGFILGGIVAIVHPIGAKPAAQSDDAARPLVSQADLQDATGAGFELADNRR